MKFLINQNHHNNDPIVGFVVNISSFMLDYILLVPSALILLHIRKDLVDSIPWWFLSLSLLLNVIADNRFIMDIVKGIIEKLAVWDLFFVTDFLIMAAALFWYFKFQNADHPEKQQEHSEI